MPSPRSTGESAPSTSSEAGVSRGENQRPAPVLPAGNVTRSRGARPEVARRWAATGPRRRKWLWVAPSRSSKARVSGSEGSGGGEARIAGIDGKEAAEHGNKRYVHGVT